MKSTIKILGIIALVVKIGITMTSCEEAKACHGDASASIIITGTELAVGNWVFLTLDKNYYGHGTVSAAGTITIDMLCFECDKPGFEAGSYTVYIRIDESSAKDSATKWDGGITNKNVPAGNSTITIASLVKLD
ncbi:MAG: hypothetical protein FWB86_14725 [Treponema sp.]|nr:hypothetical protein [Treponema sp.]